jgi:hypothetical protein
LLSVSVFLSVVSEQQIVNLLLCLLCSSLVVLREVVWSSTPVAAADDEWINGDQQGELFEALAEFSHCRRSSFRLRFPRSGPGIGAHFSAYSFCASKKSKAMAGGATPGLLLASLQEPWRPVI